MENKELRYIKTKLSDQPLTDNIPWIFFLIYLVSLIILGVTYGNNLNSYKIISILAILFAYFFVLISLDYLFEFRQIRLILFKSMIKKGESN